MKITPDEVVYFRWLFFEINLTLVMSWLVMVLLALLSFWSLYRIKKSARLSRLDVALEIIVLYLLKQLEEMGLKDPKRYLPFIGGLFAYLALSALLTLFPGYTPPTASLSTTAALALCVFFAVPLYGIRERGLLGYLKTYLQPSPIMLPFNILSDLSKTLALAIRLFGNMMSGAKVVAILVSIAPLIFPVFLRLLGLLTGMVQAYIFTVLATVYISAALRKREERLGRSD